ncbi:condensation domain-containing protein [Catenulispora yoronensis]
MTTKVKLSRIQEQLWLAERLGQHATAYMVPLILQITGPIDESALRAAFVDIVTRHEILRTRFFEQDGVLRGEVRPVADFVFETESYSLAELAERGGPAGMQAAETAVLIDVSQSIPIKVKLIRTGAGDQLLSLVLHHLVFDDWSRNQFYAELAERYRAHLAGGAASQPLALQYHEYVARQEERDAEFREESLAYWHEVLTDLDPFEIEPDHPRSARRRGRGASTGFEIEAGLATGIRRLGRAQGASPAMVLFAAAQLVLARFTGRDDVSFGTTLAAREEDEAQELIGPLINTVLLRGDLSGDPTFAELVDRMADTMLDAMEHSRIPFNELIAAHGVVADLSRNPLTQIIVQYASGVRRPPELDGCEVRELPPLTTGSKFDLVILFDEFEDGRVRAASGSTAICTPRRRSRAWPTRCARSSRTWSPRRTRTSVPCVCRVRRIGATSCSKSGTGRNLPRTARQSPPTPVPTLAPRRLPRPLPRRCPSTSANSWRSGATCWKRTTSRRRPTSS